MFRISLPKTLSKSSGQSLSNLLKLPRSRSESALAETKPILKALTVEDFSRVEKKPFRKNFIEDLFLNKFQPRVLEYPQLDTLEEVKEIKKHVKAAQILLSGEEEDEKSLQLVSQSAVSVLKKYELAGFKCPRACKGFGYLTSEYTYMHEAFGLNPALSKTISEHEDFGILLLNLFGSDEQKTQYLAKMIEGQVLASFAHCEPVNSAFIDQNTFHSTAELSSDGKNYTITGKKYWVYNGNHSDLFIVSANIVSPEGEKSSKPTLFLIDKNSPGLTVHEQIDTVGLKNLSVCDISLDKVTVSSSCVLGNVNEGENILKKVLTVGKLNNGGHCLALMRKLMKRAIDHCIKNDFFNESKCEKDYYKVKIGKMVTRLYAVESATYLLTGRYDSHTDADVFLESIIVKILASDSLKFILEETIDIIGSEFFLSDQDLLELSKDSRFYTTCDDPNEILKVYLSSAGLRYAMNHPLNSNFLIKYLYKSRQKSVFFPTSIVTKGILKGFLHKVLTEESFMLEDRVFQLYNCAFHLIQRHGNNVFQRHYELSILADLLINIYSITAMLARASRAYCVGVQFREYDKLCAEVEVRYLTVENEKLQELLLVPKKDIDLDKIGSKILNCKKYSELFSVATNKRS